MFKFLKADFLGDMNIGLYGFATDTYCLLGFEPNKKLKSKIRSILDVNLVFTKLVGTEFLGIFSSGNSNGIVLPNIVEDYELRQLKKLLNLNISVLKSKSTAIGNLILCNDKGALVSNLLKKFKKEIVDALNCEVLFGKIDKQELVGSSGLANNVGCLCHRDSSENELSLIESLLKVKVDIGTINYGTPYIKSGAVVNNNGIVLSSRTTGPELDRIFGTFRD